MSEASDGRRTAITGFALDRQGQASASHLWWIATTLVALVLRLVGLDDQALWTDEVESLKLAVQPGADPLYVVTHNFHGPLHKALLYPWVQLFGTGDFSARALSALFGAASVPVVYFTSRRWVGERAARAAIVLLAVNPFHVYYSQEVRGYILLMLFGPLGMWAFFREVERRTIGSAVGLFATSLGATLTSFGGAFLIATTGLLALVAAWRREYPVRRFVLIHLLVAICLIPYVIEFGSTVDPSSIVGIGDESERQLLRGSHTFSPLAPLHSLFAYSVGLTFGPSVNEMHRSLSLATFRPHLLGLGAAAIAFGVVALVGFVRAGRRPELRGVLLAWLVVPILATSLLAILNVKVYNVRYPCVGFVPWILLLGIGLTSLRPRAARVGLSLAVAGLTLVSLYGLRFDERYSRSDARSAAALILEQGRPGDRILNYTVVEPFRHYYSWTGGGELEINHLLGWHFKKGRLRPYLEELASCEGRLWVVRQRSWYIDPRETCKAALNEHLQPLGSWRFTDLPVELYACRPGAFSADGAGARTGPADGSARTGTSR